MILFWIIWSLWLLSEVLLSRAMRSGEGDVKNKDKGTIRIIWGVIMVCISLGVWISVRTQYPYSSGIWVRFAGLGVILLGIVIRFYSIYTLGRFFTVDVTIRKNHALKQDGLYSLVRHPSYSGSILSFIGLGISLNNWVSTLVIALPVALAFLYRISIEEKVLAKAFGESYERYRSHTGMLVPRFQRRP